MPEPVSQEQRDAIVARRMPFMEHLAELRLRIRNMVLALVATGLIAWVFRTELLQWFSVPLEEAMRNMPPELRVINYTNVLDPFMVQLKLALMGGVFLAVPVIFHQIWAFVAPGLYPHERRLALPIIVIAVLLFFGGVLFAYYLVLPKGYELLMGYASGDSILKSFFGTKATQAFQLRPMITIDDYWSLTSGLLLVFGAVFELPLILGVLAILGVVTPGALWRFNRFAAIIAFFAGAILTPGDMWLGQVAMGGSLMVLYNLSILVALVVGRKRRAARAAAESSSASAG